MSLELSNTNCLYKSHVREKLSYKNINQKVDHHKGTSGLSAAQTYCNLDTLYQIAINCNQDTKIMIGEIYLKMSAKRWQFLGFNF